jgi:hypothetical protein
MKRQLFEYKYDFFKKQMQLKPYCFRWVLAYRLKEACLWLYGTILRPFAWLAQDLERIKLGEAKDLRDIVKQPFRPIRMKDK